MTFAGRGADAPDDGAHFVGNANPAEHQMQPGKTFGMTRTDRQKSVISRLVRLIGTVTKQGTACR
jgi:hypothetical protein